MQRLKVEGFLGIESAEVTLDGIAIIIGPQASGKSVIARLFYFFNEYFADFDELPLMKNEHKKTYDKHKREDFSKIFPQYAWYDSAFFIRFENDHHHIELKSSRGSSTISLSTSASVAASFRKLKKEFQDFSESDVQSLGSSQLRLLREFRSQLDSDSLMLYDHALFVPAARSFYATLREEIFAILSMDEKIDRIIMQFGEFYETAKIRHAVESASRRSMKRTDAYRFKHYFDDIAKGKYIRVDGRDWIEMDRGRIEMNKASSGQQEAFPLLVALSQFPDPGRTLVIEEPEAHLFPSAQVKMLDFIVRQAVSKGTDMLLTTHSPYLLSAMNNFILRGSYGQKKGISPSKVSAFSLQGGVASSIIDDDTNLISADYIDEVSDEIYEEFNRTLETFG